MAGQLVALLVGIGRYDRESYLVRMSRINAIWITNGLGRNRPRGTILLGDEAAGDYITMAHKTLHSDAGLYDSDLARVLLGNRPGVENHQAANGMIHELLKSNCDPKKVPQ